MKTIFDAILADDPKAVAKFIEKDPKVLATKHPASGYTPLFTAASRGNVEIISLLLDRGAKPNVKIGNKSAIHIAAQQGHDAAARLLHQHGVPLNFSCRKGWTVLHDMLYLGRAHAVLILIDLGAQVAELGTSYGVSNAPLHLAIKSSNMEIFRQRRQVVEKLLDRGADPNQLNSEGESALHVAAAEGQAGTVNLLLDRGAKINLPDPNGATALFFAVVGGNLATVRTLLQRGAKVNAKLDKSAGELAGQTPLAAALGFNHRYIARLLHERGASHPKFKDVQAPSHKEIHSACWHGQIDDVRMILNDDPDAIRSHTDMGFTDAAPLHQAATAGHADIVRLLIQRGADVNESAMGETYTALHDAAVQGYADVAQVLAEAGADLDRDAGDSPALHEAVYWAHVDVVRVLLRAGADPNIKDDRGNTPLHKALHGPTGVNAASDRLAECAKLLRAHKARE